MDKLNVAAAARGGFPPTKMIGDLDKDVKYIVIKFRRVNTKYGPKLVCHTQTITGEEFQIFLPERVSKVMDDNLYSELCDKAEKIALFLVHLGGGRFKFEDA